MIEVFKTNVTNRQQATSLSELLLRQFSLSRASFDLEDCDKVLRLEGPAVCCTSVTSLMTDMGFECEVME